LKDVERKPEGLLAVTGADYGILAKNELKK
jgi:hypothetical protein